MIKRNFILTVCLLFAIGISPARSQSTQSKPPVPDIIGAWSGTWGIYSPAQGTIPPKDICKQLDARVVEKDGVWEASFEGDCGRPYKYAIKMEGRQIGKVVMFKGTTDLGAKDGGVFDWIGRASDKEFVGFFTSASYTGTFNLSRKNSATNELDKLQGSWNFTSLEVEGSKLPDAMLKESKIIIKGDAFTSITGGITWSGTVKADSTKNPNTIEMIFTDGPEKGKTSLGIYQLDGDKWKICLGFAGRERPTEFATRPGSGHALETLEREKK